MTTEEKFDRIWSDIKHYQEEGKIIKVMNGEDAPCVIKIENLCQQPTEGLLYDLDLDIAQLMCIHKEDPLEFANQMANVNVIKFLHKFYLDNKDKVKSINKTEDESKS